MELIWGEREAENFCWRDWTAGIALKLKENFRFWRSRTKAVKVTQAGLCGKISGETP
jgi:hypothetical protein